MAVSKNIQSLAKQASVAAGALAAYPKIVKEAGAFAIRGAEQLGEFSGQIGAGLLDLEAARLQLLQQRAVAVERSTLQLMASQERLERSMAPIANQLTNIQNTVLADLADLASQLVDALTSLLAIESREERLPSVPAQLIQDIASGRLPEPLPEMK